MLSYSLSLYHCSYQSEEVIECHSYVTCAAKSIVFLNLSLTYLQPTGRGDGALSPCCWPLAGFVMRFEALSER